nr:cation:proton antiporter [Janibacter alkaliphilus]
MPSLGPNLPLAAASSGDGPSLPVYLALVLALAVACQWAAWALRIPSLLLLLIVGFGLGQWVTADDVLGTDALFSVTTIAVGIILFEGSLSLRLRELRGISGPVVRLCSSVVVLAWALLTAAGLVVGIDWRLALLLGAILAVTGPTVINPDPAADAPHPTGVLAAALGGHRGRPDRGHPRGARLPGDRRRPRG